MRIDLEWRSKELTGGMQADVPNIFSGYTICRGIVELYPNCDLFIRVGRFKLWHWFDTADAAKARITAAFIDSDLPLGEVWE